MTKTIIKWVLVALVAFALGGVADHFFINQPPAPSFKCKTINSDWPEIG